MVGVHAMNTFDVHFMNTGGFYYFDGEKAEIVTNPKGWYRIGSCSRDEHPHVHGMNTNKHGNT